VLPGLIAFKLFGDVDDVAYGRLVAAVLPPWLSGAFAAVIAGAGLSSFNSTLNSASALYTCDLHAKYINADADYRRVGQWVAVVFTLVSLAVVPVFEHARSIIDTLQRLNGLYSMPVLAAFVVAVVFGRVNTHAVRAGLLFGVLLYAGFTFIWSPLHYIHLMFITLASTVSLIWLLDRVLGGACEAVLPAR